MDVPRLGDVGGWGWAGDGVGGMGAGDGVGGDGYLRLGFLPKKKIASERTPNRCFRSSKKCPLICLWRLREVQPPTGRNKRPQLLLNAPDDICGVSVDVRVPRYCTLMRESDTLLCQVACNCGRHELIHLGTVDFGREPH